MWLVRRYRKRQKQFRQVPYLWGFRHCRETPRFQALRRLQRYG